MKDLYTFHATPEDLDEWYLKVRKAYQNILDRMELHYRIVSADSGNIGGSSSEEFMILCDIGEDTIVYSDESEFASNFELYNLQVGDPSPDGKGHILHAKGIEAGHIFKLGTKYSSPMKANFIDKDGITKPIIMGCYGMGISRLLMAILEQHYRDEKAIWPREVRPFDVHILPLDKEQTANYNIALEVYDKLSKAGYDCLFDDRQESPGVKFKDADLIGVRNRIVVGRRASEGIFEFKDIKENITKEITFSEMMSMNFKR